MRHTGQVVEGACSINFNYTKATMTYFAGPAVLAPVGTTGNNTHTGVGVSPADSHCAVLTVEAAGATPTVTLSLQGSLDGNTWNTLGTINSNTANTSAPASTQVLTGWLGAYIYGSWDVFQFH
jgi:hypothetical protein